MTTTNKAVCRECGARAGHTPGQDHQITCPLFLAPLAPGQKIPCPECSGYDNGGDDREHDSGCYFAVQS